MKKILSLIFLLAVTLSIKAQLLVTNGYNAQSLAETLAGFNLDVTNASLTGANLQYGKFNFTGTSLGVNSGVILSTGNIFQAVGPNNEEGTSTGFGRPGNPLLSDLSGYQTNDAVVLQFDFTVQTDMIEFKYIFLSEEYNEFVNTGFNDVFAFFISGPGITGEENLAVVPGTSTPVTINSINNQSFWQFYRDNTNGNTNIEFDGFTTLMTAKKTGLIPCQTYTLKLMIADATDDIYDAGVLLQENSLIQANVSASAYTFSENNTALEGCIDASFTFQIDSAMTYDTYIPIGVGGSALNGIDYNKVDTLIVIPAGQKSAKIIVKAFADGLAEGQESVELYFTPGACMPKDTVFLYINDYQTIQYETTPYDALCNGTNNGEVLFTVSGGIEPYTIFLTDTLTGITNEYHANPIENLPAGTYKVNVIDGYGCTAEDIVFGGEFQGAPIFIPDGNGISYTTTIPISGFGADQTLTSLNQFKSVCATMEHSFVGELEIKLQTPDGTEVILKKRPGGSITNLGEPVAKGSVDQLNNNIVPGIGYTYCWTANPEFLTMQDEAGNYTYTYVTQIGTTESDRYLPGGSYTSDFPLSNLVGSHLNGNWNLIITDNKPNDNGYVFDWSLSISAEQPDSIFTISEPLLPVITETHVNPTCGGNNGSINLTVSGGESPYSFLWSNGKTTEDINNLTSGTYTVQVTSADECTYPFTVNLSSTTAISVTGSITNQACPGTNTGAINISVSNGTSPYSFAWSNGSTSEDLNSVAAGNYTVTVTDAASCTIIKTFEILAAVPVSATANITNEHCGDKEGIIDISATGGVEPYTYVWSNGKTTQDINELAQGNYTVTIKDANNCSKSFTFSVENIVGSCIPDCDLSIISQNISNENCGNSDGSVDLTIFTTNSPYNVLWSNSSVSDDISNLSAGNYNVTIEDAAGCTMSNNFIIENNSGNLDILSIEPVNEECGNQQGSVNLTVAGGAMPYSFNWSNGATTEDLTNIHGGEYSVSVTDANNCKVNSSATVENFSGTLELIWGNSANEVCNNNQGSIDIIIGGGNPPYTFTWTNGSHQEDLHFISEGSYSCTITDSHGCKIFTPVYTVLNEAGTLIINEIDIDNEICNNNLGDIQLFIAGGTTPYQYLWNTGATSSQISNLTAGTFSATVSDNYGCSISTGDLIVIDESGTLQIQNITSKDELCGNSLGQIDLTVSGGTIPYNFSWNTGSTSEDLVNISEGNYSCTVSDFNGCEVSVNSVIQNNQGTLAVANTIITNETCGNSNGAINQIISGGTIPYSFNWNNTSVNEDLSGLTSGNYICQISDNQGCELINSVNVLNITGSLSLSNYALTNEQCGQSNGSIDLTISGTQTPFTYLWTNGSLNQDLTGIAAGIYSCEITDFSGCSIVAGPFTVNNTSQSMSVSGVQITDASCGSANGAVNITLSGGTSPITYLWSNGATTQDLTNVIAGNYSYTITDATGCSISGTSTVKNTSGNLMISGFVVTDEICSNGNGAIDITVSGGTAIITYLWNSGQTSQDLSDISEGNYSVIITDGNSCQFSSNVYHVSNNPGNFNLENIIVTDALCNDTTGAITVTLSGGALPYTHLWNNGDVTKNLMNIGPGVYSCLTSDANGCVLNYSATVNNLPGNLFLENISINDETCGTTNGSVDITIVGGSLPLVYQWSNGSVDEDLTNIDAGNYSCLITDDNGCQINADATVNDLSGDFAIYGIETTPENCGNGQGSINLTITGGVEPYSYLWSNGATSQDLMNVSAGIYDVEVTDANECFLSSQVELLNIEGTLLVSDFEITDEYCGNGEGAINITYTGAAEPVVFEWSNGSSAEDISNLSSGNYDILITDNNGCTTSETYFVDNITNGFIIENASVNNEYCGDASGSIDLTLSGGFTPYTFLWNNGETTEDLSDLPAGIYTCTISDNSGCIINFSEEITNQTNGLVVGLVSVQNSYCGSETGSIDINVSGGNEPYTFIWNNGDTSEDLLNVASGTYNVIVTDANNCKIISEYTIDEDTNPDLGFAYIFVQNDYCGEGQGYIEVQPIIWDENYIFELNGTPYPFPYFYNLLPGTYNISIIDGSCSVDTTVVVENDANFMAQLQGTNDEVCGNGLGSINIVVNPPQGNYSYLWSNGATTQDINNLHEGVYTCQITKIQNGCKDYITVEIFNEVTYTTSFEVNDENCSNSDGAIDITVSGSSGFTYLWNTGAITQDLLNIPAGSYSCEISDVSGCIDYVNAEVVNSTGNMLVSYFLNDDYCNGNQGSIELYISGVTDYSVIWSNDETSESIYNLGEGNYWVTVTNNDNGCEYYQEFTINNLYGFDVAENITNSSCQACNDGSINLTVSPAGVYYFDWSNFETTEDVYNLLPGDYYVNVYNDWCYSTYYYTVDYTSIIDDTSDFIINIYPNPANRDLFIDYNLFDESSADVLIFDALGRIITKTQLNGSKGLLKVDMTDKANGIYFIKIISETETSTFKIVKK